MRVRSRWGILGRVVDRSELRARRFQAAGGVALAALAIIASSFSVAPSTSAAGAGDASPADVEQAISFRERLGFRSDRSFVQSTFGRAGFSKSAWGVPLDRVESNEVGRRAEVQHATGPALRAAAEDSKAAGAYFDQAQGGVPVFLTTGEPSRA